MAETLIAWFTRFTDDPKKAAARLRGKPVLLFDPPVRAESSDDADDDFQFRTSAGDAAISTQTGEAVVAVVEKTKDNAFQRRVTIGRTSNNDIVLEDASVSRFHAWLQQDEPSGGWSVIDAGSRNGTYVASRKTAPKQPVTLVDGAALRIGSVDLKFFTVEGFMRYLQKRSEE